MTNNKKITLPSMLSFERKLETSDGLMYAGNWGDKDKEHLGEKKEIKAWQAIQIVPRQNRSTQSAYGIDDIKKTAPNPVSSDSDDANLPMDKDTLKLSFTLRVIGNLGKPFACNAPDFAQAIERTISGFKESEGIGELAFRYAYNIANGRFLWRNRVCAEKIRIQVYLNKDETPLTFNAYDFTLHNFDKNKDDVSLNKLADAIQKGLSSDEENSFVFLKVYAFVKLGKGQHIFPSQEMNMGEKKKKLFQLNKCAAMHNVKIGNAIRTIDTWYGDEMLIKVKKKGKDAVDTIDIESGFKQPIAIEPYGSVTQHGRAYRSKGIDLYTLMHQWVNNEDIGDQESFLVGNLIRGGVFGGDS